MIIFFFLTLEVSFFSLTHATNDSVFLFGVEVQSCTAILVLLYYKSGMFTVRECKNQPKHYIFIYTCVSVRVFWFWFFFLLNVVHDAKMLVHIKNFFLKFGDASMFLETGNLYRSFINF